jgi:spore coat polysaccharide biosynthesis predicted glycosyltransferase SpsG
LKRVNYPDLEVKIVAGASNPNIEILKDAVHSDRCTMSILSNVKNMAKLMAWADVAVTAAGSTCLELSFMRLPFAAITLAENQNRISEKVEQAGIAIRCGWYYELDAKSLEKRLSQLIHDSSCRSRMSEKAGDLVDGCGAERVIDVLEGAP